MEEDLLQSLCVPSMGDGRHPQTSVTFFLLCYLYPAGAALCLEHLQALTPA